MVLLAPPHKLGFAGEVILVELDQRAQTGAVSPGEPVGVLSDDEVTLLQAQDALRLYAERSYAEVGSSFHERLPHVEPIGGGYVDLVAQLASEADAPHEAVFYTGDTSGANPHVGEGVR